MHTVSDFHYYLFPTLISTITGNCCTLRFIPRPFLILHVLEDIRERMSWKYQRKHFLSPYREGEKINIEEYYRFIFENVKGLLVFGKGFGHLLNAGHRADIGDDIPP